MTTLFGRILIVWTILSCKEGFAQGPSGPAAALQNTPNGKIIYAWYTAWSKNDWNSLEQVLATGFTFSSPHPWPSFVHHSDFKFQAINEGHHDFTIRQSQCQSYPFFLIGNLLHCYSDIPMHFQPNRF